MKKYFIFLTFVFLSIFFVFAQEVEEEEILTETPTAETPQLTEATSDDEIEIEIQAEENLNIIYKGEHHLNIGLGMTVPVFMHFYNNPQMGKNGVVLSSEHYDPPVGLAGYFNYRFFFDKGWALGAELGGSYIRTTQNSQTLVHIMAEATYMIRRWPVDIPISFGIGAHFNSLQQEYPATDLQSGGLFFKPSIGFSYNINENWGIGLTTAWSIIPEIYLSDGTPEGDYLEKQSAFSHVWSLAINIRYRFQ